MASTPGQNVHLVLPHNQVLVSSFLTNIVSLCHYSFILQLVVLPFNSSCRLSTVRATMSFTVLGKRGDLRDLGTTTE